MSKHTKRMLTGVVFLLGALLIIFKDSIVLPDTGIPLWILVVGAIFSWLSLMGLKEKDYAASILFAGILFLILNNYYEWLVISTWQAIAASVLTIIGLQYIFKKPDKDDDALTIIYRKDDI